MRFAGLALTRPGLVSLITLLFLVQGGCTERATFCRRLSTEGHCLKSFTDQAVFDYRRSNFSKETFRQFDNAVYFKTGDSLAFSLPLKRPLVRAERDYLRKNSRGHLELTPADCSAEPGKSTVQRLNFELKRLDWHPDRLSGLALLGDILYSIHKQQNLLEQQVNKSQHCPSGQNEIAFSVALFLEPGLDVLPTKAPQLSIDVRVIY